MVSFLSTFLGKVKTSSLLIIAQLKRLGIEKKGRFSILEDAWVRQGGTLADLAPFLEPDLHPGSYSI